MKRRILTLALALIMALSCIPSAVLASENITVDIEELAGYNYDIAGFYGTCFFNDDETLGIEQHLITTDSCITLNFPVDFLDVWDSDNEQTVFMPDFYGQEGWVTTPVVNVNGEVKTRKDVSNYMADSLEQGDMDINFFASGTTIKFNQPGNYSIMVEIGYNNAEERLYFLKEYGPLPSETGHYIFEISVRVDTGSNISYDEDIPFYDDYTEPEYSIEDAYNKDLISIEGIKDIYMPYEYNVGQEGYLAYCTSPVVITAQCKLDDFAVYPMYYKDEFQLLDEKFPIYPDGKQASDYDWYVHHQEVYKTEPDIDLVEYVYADKGEKYTITKPGYYHLYATIYDEEGNYENDIRSMITLKITDLNAIYTSSTVLVDGEKRNFEAYNIEGNNYFKLRDIAMLLNKNNAPHQFVNVTWDDSNKVVNVVRGEKYQAVGGEFATGDGLSKLASYGATELYIDGYPTPVRAYIINGNNYFKLRDLAELFMFDVGWDAENSSVIIDTLSPLND